MSGREQLLAFLGTIALPGADLAKVREDENLVESGIIDSLAVIEIFSFLETDHDLDVSTIDPTRLMSIAGILSVTEE